MGSSDLKSTHLTLLLIIFHFILSFSLCSCTSMPERFKNSDRSLHPRFGIHITNESDTYFDIEIMVMDYSFAYTAGEDQIARAKELFITVAKEYAADKGRTIIDPPLVELYMYQVRNEIDGTNTTRISKRINWKEDTEGAKKVLELKKVRVAEWEKRKARLEGFDDDFE